MKPASRALGFLALALVAAVILGFAYWIFIRTHAGQVIDNAAYLGRSGATPRAALRARDLLDVIVVTSVAAMAVIIVIVAVIRRSLLVGTLAVGGFIAAVAAAQILKLVLPRPNLDPVRNDILDKGLYNTFPSGHTTIAAGASLALIIVSSPAFRPILLWLGTAFTSAVACAVVIAGWHRPSDAVGGIATAACVLSLAASLAVAVRGEPVTPTGLARWAPVANTFVLLLLGGALVLALRLGWSSLQTAALIVLGCGLIVEAALVLTITAWMLRDVEWALPSRVRAAR